MSKQWCQTNVTGDTVQSPDLTCATWNVHRAKGRDGKRDPGRIVNAIETAIAPIEPDVLALQEADEECPPHAQILDIPAIEATTGLHCIHTDPALRWGPESSGFLGTILFVAPRLNVVHTDLIDLAGHCHRGAVSLELTDGLTRFRLMSMHLSLSQSLRAVQMRTLGQYIRRRPSMQTVLLGDLNEWRPWGGFAFSKSMLGRKFSGPAPATFPTRTPILPLDRIMSDEPGTVREARVLNTPETNIASDHCPLVAKVTIKGTVLGEPT
ncbi:endonuclease/exonuclease/phosphatase family protein [Litoreibacter roseus]|uniref:Endonuclease n=1 Tax=Litoreibacter roseus TaxID=2601869 RepID=A0A6N6JE88_9RHOB|nr:endonuclease/exonuclease/phosphatase family protein [Litoreibacter roseus]GFE64661.1 endonuclease [Litoreibacter roseus]